MIETLNLLGKHEIADDILNAELFTVIADDTADKNRKEIQGLAYRYLVNNKIKYSDFCDSFVSCVHCFLKKIHLKNHL